MNDVLLFESKQSMHHLHCEETDFWFGQDLAFFEDIIETLNEIKDTP